MANVIEEAKSGRASCRTCRKSIAKGELRLGVETQTQFSDAPSMQWHHLSCAAAKHPDELKAALADYPGEVPGRAELDALARQELAGGPVPTVVLVAAAEGGLVERGGEPADRGAIGIRVGAELVGPRVDARGDDGVRLSGGGV